MMIMSFFNIFIMMRLEKLCTIPKEERKLDAVLLEIKYFPIPTSIFNHSYGVTFQNDYGSARNFGQKHEHEGCDIIATKQIPGIYPIVSMTDGSVEQIGYLNLGGYRIGIRSPSNFYYYYAHLSSYYKDFQVGDHVKAGDILGYMGNSGYGKEVTTGKMPVHLHVGIYHKNKDGDLISMNPYPYLIDAFNNRKWNK